MMKDMDSDIVELIIAVDLNPSDPEELINVNNVDVRSKGEGADETEEDWKGLVMKLLADAGEDTEGMDYYEAAEAVSRVTDGAKKESDPFSKAKALGGPLNASRGRFGKRKEDEF